MIKPKNSLIQFVDAFNNADVKKITSLSDENAANHQVANEPVVGKTAIRKMHEQEFTTADMSCIVQILLKMANGRSWNGKALLCFVVAGFLTFKTVKLFSGEGIGINCLS